MTSSVERSTMNGTDTTPERPLIEATLTTLEQDAAPLSLSPGPDDHHHPDSGKQGNRHGRLLRKLLLKHRRGHRYVVGARRPPGTRQWWILSALIVMLAGCSDAGTAGSGFSFVSPGGKTEFAYPVDQRGTVSEISGPNVLDGSPLALSDYPDRVVVLNVWGSWCAPCRAEAESLNTAADLTAALPVQFLGIDIRDTRDGAAEFLQAKKVPYPSIFDPSMRAVISLRGFPTSSIPSTIILDRRHRVAQIYLRVVTTAEIVRTVKALAGEGVQRNGAVATQ
jgi:thiol-disulfide isomerase/thioredoxin